MAKERQINSSYSFIADIIIMETFEIFLGVIRRVCIIIDKNTVILGLEDI